MQQNWSVMIQALTSRILTLKINQGTKFGTLKKPIFSLFDVVIYLFIFWLNGIMKQTYRVWLPVNNIWNNRLLRIVTFPWITAFFMVWKKTDNCPRLLFEEIQYLFLVSLKCGLKQNCYKGIFLVWVNTYTFHASTKSVILAHQTFRCVYSFH